MTNSGRPELDGRGSALPLARQHTPSTLISGGDVPLTSGRRDHVADKLERPVGFRRPVGRGTHPHDHQMLGWNHDDVFADGALAKKASRGRPCSMRYLAPKLSPRLVQNPAP